MESPAAEICGLLIGAPGRITSVTPSPNRHPEPANGFAICDAVYARVQAKSRTSGLNVMGCYHSHPSGDLAPSQTDVLAVIEDSFIWIIANPGGQLAAWRAIARPPVKGFEPLQIVTD
jgi:proteasome lid subunit RPN8/RPN11